MQKTPEAGSSFGPAFLLLDGPQRRALSAYYAFARQADDIADAPEVPAAEKHARLDAWRCGVEGLFSGSVPDTPLARELAAAIAAFPLKKEHFLLVLDGVESDISHAQPRTMAELERYMYRVASAVGLACLAVFRYEGRRAGELAEKLGYAVQLTNILRDVAEDAAAGRVYLPAEDLERFGCAAGDLAGSNYTPNFIELMEFEGARAARFYDEAFALADPAAKGRLLPALAMARLYRDLLERMAGLGWRVKGDRVRLSRARKAAALLKAGLDYLRI